MRFYGFWISDTESGVHVESYCFDETELSESSNWTEAHQNEDPENPAGYIDPARILSEAGLKLLEKNPDIAKATQAVDFSSREIKSIEDFGYFSLHLSLPVAEDSRRAAKRG